MKYLYLLSFYLLWLSTAFSQPQPFANFFGDNNVAEQGVGVVQLPSGSIFMAGTANVDSIGGFDLSLSKFDANGNLIWQKYYGTTQSDFANGLLFMDKEYFIISGSTTAPSLRNDAVLCMVDTTGKEQWLEVYTDSMRSSYFKTVTKTTDGNLIASGAIGALNGNGNDSYIMKTDLLGNTLWTSTLRDSAIDIAHATVNTDDGGYMVAGDVQRPGGHYNIYAAKLDAQGDVTWKKTFTSINNGGAQNLIHASNGNFLITGESWPDTMETYFDIYLVMIKPDGEVVWDSYIGDPLAEAGYKIFESQPGIFIGAGYGFNFTNNSTDIIVTRVDSNGNEIDRKYFGNQFLEQGFDIAPSVYGEFGFVATGFSAQGLDDQYFLVYDAFPPLQTEGLENLPSKTVNIYPNPAINSQAITLELPPESVDWQITDIHGRVITTFHTSFHQDKFHIQADFPFGYYLIKGNGKSHFYHNRLLILDH